MPSRFVSLAILIYWSIAAFCLLTWDVIPELTMGYPPDLRAIALAGDSIKPVRWSIQVIDDPRSPDVAADGRRGGDAVVAPARRLVRADQPGRDRCGGTARGNPLPSRASVRLEVESVYRVDPSGNLHSFDLDVKSRESAETLIKIKGQLKGKKMEIVSRVRCRS